MDIRVHGKNMQVGVSVRALANAKVGRAARFLDGGVEADVEFEERHNPAAGGDRYAVEISSRAARRTVRVVATPMTSAQHSTSPSTNSNVGSAG